MVYKTNNESITCFVIRLRNMRTKSTDKPYDNRKTRDTGIILLNHVLKLYSAHLNLKRTSTKRKPQSRWYSLQLYHHRYY